MVISAELTVAQRVSLHLERIGAISASAPSSGWTRLAFSSEENEVHEYARGVLRELGCELSNDSFMNLYGDLGSEGQSGEGAVMLGTHLDTVKNGGNFDGVVGFIVAVESVRNVLQGKKRIPAIRIAIFRAEESTLFKKACLGSRAAFQGMTESELGLTFETDSHATLSLGQRVAAAGGAPDDLSKPTLNKDAYRAYFETHIEQARVLEQSSGLDRIEGKQNLDKPPSYIGIVTSIRAPYRCEWEVAGERSIPLFAKCVLAVEAAATLVSDCSLDAVATVGRVDGFITGPDKINAVPGEANFQVISKLDLGLLKQCERICAKRGCSFEVSDNDFGIFMHVSGTTDHSGGTPMGLTNRKDALAASCEILCTIPSNLIAPCTGLKFYTDVRSNSIPVRDLVGSLIASSFESIDSFERSLHGASSARVEKVRRTEMSTPLDNLSDRLQRMIADAAQDLAIEHIYLPSGAGHDAMMAAVVGVPTAMMFIPSIAGLSHTPMEFSRIKDIIAAIEVQSLVLEKLGSNNGPVE